MKISLRGWIVLGAFAATAAALVLTSQQPARAVEPATASAEQAPALGEAELGRMLSAMGLKPKQEEKRFDFTFKAVHQGDEWELSMSAVLSQNGNSVWLMAWLDELPRSAAEVPRTALLRLLSLNDRLGQGKFFAYIPTNRRFVLQRVVETKDLSTGHMQEALKDLGVSVVESYPHWNVANWSGTPTTRETAAGGASKAGADSTTGAPGQLSRRATTRTATSPAAGTRN
ncbi:MAG: hypothetical protein KDA79_12675 [Planctomycetaceae bacterium]|nr:hypothetical protein [Planctomycetaceae bacterium]